MTILLGHLLLWQKGGKHELYPPLSGLHILGFIVYMQVFITILFVRSISFPLHVPCGFLTSQRCNLLELVLVVILNKHVFTLPQLRLLEGHIIISKSHLIVWILMATLSHLTIYNDQGML